MYETELHRLKGELPIAQDATNSSQAEQCFRTGIAISRCQHAKWWELHATTNLARLLAKQGKRDEGALDARQSLQVVYRELRHRRSEGRQALVRRYEQMIGFANRQSIKALRGPGPIE